jgi:hypothetical protein
MVVNNFLLPGLREHQGQQTAGGAVIGGMQWRCGGSGKTPGGLLSRYGLCRRNQARLFSTSSW